MAKTSLPDGGIASPANEERETVTDALFDRSLRGGRLFLGLLLFSTVLVIGWFQLRVGIWGAYEGQIQRPVYLCLFLFFVYLYPLFREKTFRFWLVLKNVIPAIMSLVVLYYYLSNYHEIIYRMGIAEPVDYFYGIVLIILVLEATRRTAGLAIVIVGVSFILYSFFGNYFPGQLYHHGFSLSRIIGIHLTTADGLFGVPMGVASTFLVLFILFGSALSNSGAIDYFLNIANALVGKYNAGPAKLAVIGSRTFNDYEWLDLTIYKLMYLDIMHDALEIISGGAKGADSLAKRFAKDYDAEYTEFPADWDKYGKSAGFRRNQSIIDACDMVLAFWDGKSRGTQDSIEKAKIAKKPTFIMYF